MFNKIKEMRRIADAANEQGISLKRKLNLYWLTMVTAIMAALLLILSFTGVFSGSSKKLQSSLMLQQQNSLAALTSHMDSLEAGCINLSRQLSNVLGDVFFSKGIEFTELNDNPQLIAELENALYPYLNASLGSFKCSGIFAVLNATCNTSAPQADTSRIGIYLRYSDLSGVNTANKHIVYFRGCPETARKENVQMHNRWNLEFDTSLIPNFDSYMGHSVSRLADECRWSEKIEMKDTWENSVLLFVPILGNDSSVLGLCGVELSELYFRLAYPSAEGPYGSMLPLAAPMESSTVYLDKAMIGSSADTALPSVGAMTVKDGRYANTYSTGNRDFLGFHQILPAKLNTGRNLAMLTLISESGFHKAVRTEKTILTVSLTAVIAVMLILSQILTRQFVSPISQLLSAIKNERPIEEQRSGFSEIDEIIDALQSRAQLQSSENLPPKVEALLKSFTQRVQTLTPMERTVLQLYIDDCSIEEVAAKSFISVNTAKKHNTNINHKLGVKSREELMLYIDLFRRCGKINDISYKI